MCNALIKGGMIIDCSSSRPAYRADVAISSGEVAAIGDLAGESAHETINAEGHMVTPGFIDIQNHSDSYGALLRNPSLESMLLQGITTILVGHAGSSLAPLLKGSLASIQKWTDVTGVNVDWRSMAEFLHIVDVRGLGPNVATLIGHATLRRDLIGDATGTLSKKERDQLKTLLKRSMKEGGWGLSMGLEYTHERAAEEPEFLDALSTVASERGIASFHLRDEGKGFFQSLSEIIELVTKSGVLGKISRLKIEHEDDPSVAQRAVDILQEARNRGTELFIDVYPYEVSASTLYLLLPNWATEGGRVKLLERLKNPELKGRMAEEIKGQGYAYQDIRIASSVLDRTLMGRSIQDLAQNQETTPEDIILNTLSASGDQMIVFFKNSSEALFEVFVKWEGAMIATNGVGYSAHNMRDVREMPHPRSFGTTGRILGHYVRDKKLLTLEEAVHKMSGLPAAFLGLKERGILEKGNYGDIVVFDSARITDAATFEKPFASPPGIAHVFINGTQVVRDGAYTGKTPGVVLHK